MAATAARAAREGRVSLGKPTITPEAQPAMGAGAALVELG